MLTTIIETMKKVKDMTTKPKLNSKTSRANVDAEFNREEPRWADLINANLLTMEDFSEHCERITNSAYGASHISDFIEKSTRQGKTFTPELIEKLIDLGHIVPLVDNKLASLQQIIDAGQDSRTFFSAVRVLDTPDMITYINSIIATDVLSSSNFNTCFGYFKESDEMNELLCSLFVNGNYEIQSTYWMKRIVKYFKDEDMAVLAPKLSISAFIDSIGELNISTESFDEHVLPLIVRHYKSDHKNNDTLYDDVVTKEFQKNKAAVLKYMVPHCNPFTRAILEDKIVWETVDENMEYFTIKQRYELLTHPSVPGWFLKENMHFMVQLQIPGILGSGMNPMVQHLLHHDMLMSKVFK